MVEKDIIEAKYQEKKEKIEDEKEKFEEKVEDGKEKFSEKKEYGKNIADNMARDISRGMDELLVNMKSVQEIVDQKIKEYKKTKIETLDFDLLEDEEKYYIKVAVPGIEKENIEIEADDAELTIEATFTPFEEELIDVEEVKTLKSELKTGRCSNKIKFSTKIDVENISAKFTNGIVYITISKVQAPKYKVNVD